MLLSKSAPAYPPIAKAARVSGTVVLQATISKSGAIENLHVISGPAMLQQAALDAVKTWRYRPYLLNNEPVEVETTVNVIFSLGG
jgi:protein TonB